MRVNYSKGLVFLSMCVVAGTLVPFLVHAAREGLGLFAFNMWWFVFGAIVQFTIVISQGKLSLIRVEKRKSIIVLSVAIAVDVVIGIMLFASFRALPTSITGIIFPIGTMLQISSGLFFLREKATPVFITGGLLSVIGLVVMRLTPASVASTYPVWGVWLLIATNVLIAANASFIRVFMGKGDYHPEAIAPLRAMAMLVVMSILAVVTGEIRMLAGYEWVILPIGGAIGAANFYFSMKALQNLPISVFALQGPAIATVMLVSSFIIYKELPLPQELIGGIVIITGTVLASLGLRKKSAPKTLPVTSPGAE